MILVPRPMLPKSRLCEPNGARCDTPNLLHPARSSGGFDAPADDIDTIAGAVHSGPQFCRTVTADGVSRSRRGNAAFSPLLTPLRRGSFLPGSRDRVNTLFAAPAPVHGVSARCLVRGGQGRRRYEDLQRSRSSPRYIIPRCPLPRGQQAPPDIPPKSAGGATIGAVAPSATSHFCVTGACPSDGDSHLIPILTPRGGEEQCSLPAGSFWNLATPAKE